MMKKLYVGLKVDVAYFSEIDIICTSIAGETLVNSKDVFFIWQHKHFFKLKNKEKKNDKKK